MTDKISTQIETDEQLNSFLGQQRTWGRWGHDDQVGAVNLVDASKRVQAASLVKNGRTLSLSRPFPKTPAANNPNPAQHWVRTNTNDTGGGASDYYAIAYHGFASTHIDALCHQWGVDGMWNGRTPSEISPVGAQWGGIENWSNGIITRGVLLDVPRYRGEPFVTFERPVRGAELLKVAEAQGVEIQPGDAVCIYSGREEFSRQRYLYGSISEPIPGLHADCLAPLRDWDVSTLVWDMFDMMPSGFTIRIPVHRAISAFGIALVDNALLEPLAAACAEEGRFEFMLTLAPLLVEGGTGSPLNPIAIF